MARENNVTRRITDLEILIPADANYYDQLVLDPTAEFVPALSLYEGPAIRLTFRHPGQPVTPRRPIPSNEPAR